VTTVKCEGPWAGAGWIGEQSEEYGSLAGKDFLGHVRA
jgi:hypothetical protein